MTVFYFQTIKEEISLPKEKENRFADVAIL